MSVREIDWFLERWRMDVDDVRGADSPGAGTLARPLALGPRVDFLGYGEGGPAALMFEQPGSSPTRELWMTLAAPKPRLSRLQ